MSFVTLDDARELRLALFAELEGKTIVSFCIGVFAARKPKSICASPA